MNRPISTKVHGILDYVSVPTLLALPRVLRCGRGMTTLLTSAAVSVLGYSALTRYELGLYRVLPLKVHLAFDLTSGALLAAAPFAFLKRDEQSGTATGVLVGFGLFEIVAALLTKTEPPLMEQLDENPIPQWLEERVGRQVPLPL